jgi:hypothetical protein
VDHPVMAVVRGCPTHQKLAAVISVLLVRAAAIRAGGRAAGPEPGAARSRWVRAAGHPPMPDPAGWGDADQ